MPKGRNGCFVCGAPTVLTLQVWLRVRSSVGDQSEKTIRTVARSLCWSCGAAYWQVARAAMKRAQPAYHGCAACAATTTLRMQSWMRTKPPGSVSVATITTAFCTPCGEAAFGRMWVLLDGDSQRHARQHSAKANLVRARAARRQAKAVA